MHKFNPLDAYYYSLAGLIMLILTIIASQQSGYSAIIIGLVLCIVGVNLNSWLQMNTRAH
ncbi:hypothetical protein ACEN4A_01690 [Latilactobacillus sakei]|uniref:hypothetical protein n=1 Tax=Latilactobacillus sakei TaxID=1599 RepID=UPI003883BD84